MRPWINITSLSRAHTLTERFLRGGAGMIRRLVFRPKIVQVFDAIVTLCDDFDRL